MVRPLNRRQRRQVYMLGQTSTAQSILDMFGNDSNQTNGEPSSLFNVGVEFENKQLVKLGVTIFGSILAAQLASKLL